MGAPQSSAAATPDVAAWFHRPAPRGSADVPYRDGAQPSEEVLVGVELVAAHLAVERRTGDSQQLRGEHLVAARPLDRRHDRVELHLFHLRELTATGVLPEPGREH